MRGVELYADAPALADQLVSMLGTPIASRISHGCIEAIRRSRSRLYVSLTLSTRARGLQTQASAGRWAANQDWQAWRQGSLYSAAEMADVDSWSWPGAWIPNKKRKRARGR